MSGHDLPKPMPLSECVHNIIFPTYALLPPKFNHPKRTVMLLSIFQQEGAAQFRIQQPNGPAKGFWQFESGGGVKGVMTHKASKDLAKYLCDELGVPFERKAVYDALELDDRLACGFACLLLYTDPRPLPEVDDVISAMEPDKSYSWRYYYDNWRPGKPHPEKWRANHNRAQMATIV